MPREALAGSLGFDIVRTVVDSQLQGVHALTTRIVGVVVSVRTRRGISRVVPGEALASNLRFDIVRAVVDRQLQCVNALATRIVGISICVRT